MSPQRLELPNSYLEAKRHDQGLAVDFALFVSMVRKGWVLQPSFFYHNTYSGDVRYGTPGSGGFGFFSFPYTTTAFSVQQMGLGGSVGRVFGAAHEEHLQVLVGSRVGWRIKSLDAPSAPASPSQSEAVRYAIETAHEPLQLQLTGEVGWWGRHWGVSLQGVHGLTSLVRRVELGNTAYPFQVSNTSLMVSLGYRLPLKELLASSPKRTRSQTTE
ncbi:hypothetical protein [Hymenobacter sp. DG01]|uniref:hypothetical protein n=1 Tax=Hymenobacter sp. DG01 TaxID=2584940 RepID=UPI00111FAB92|nr:hypothetical protein [Hymenobacter sp. DG01]